MINRHRPYPLPVRKAILVWIGCALAGWVFALVSIYSVVRFGDTLTAAFRDEKPAVSDQQKLEEIAPAAGETPPATQ